MPYTSGGDHRTERYQPAPTSNYDNISNNIPIWRDWSGAATRQAQQQDALAADANRAYWDDLNAPTADDLEAHYNYDPGSEQAQQMALQNLQQWGRGGLTGADRGMMEATRRRDEQAEGASRGAIQQQSQARGMGGSGLDYAAQLSGAQQGQQRTSDAEAQMMQGAQQRALSAIQASGQLSSQMRQQGQHETETQAQARPTAIQQSYEDAASRAAGATGQYGTDTQNHQQARDRQQQTDNGLLGFIGEIL